jgi:hypothetical protein
MHLRTSALATSRVFLSTLLLAGLSCSAWSAETPTPHLSLHHAQLTRAWSAADEVLSASTSTLVMTLEVQPPLGYRILGRPLVRVTTALAADGTDVRMRAARPQTEDAPVLDPEPSRWGEFTLRAPPAPFSSLQKLSGTCTMRLAPTVVKDAVLAPLSAWLGKPLTLADDQSAEFTLYRHDDDQHLYLEFNAAAAERFAGLRLTTAAGAEIDVPADEDWSDAEAQTVTRGLPEDTPGEATLAVHFIGNGERCVVPFTYTALSFPAETVTNPTVIPLSEPKPAPAQPLKANDGRF